MSDWSRAISDCVQKSFCDDDLLRLRACSGAYDFLKLAAVTLFRAVDFLNKNNELTVVSLLD